MARVAMVETYPYEAAHGGDALYADGVRQYLGLQGHVVRSYITDVARGRSDPRFRLRSAATGDQGWIVRRAVRSRGGRFLSLAPGLYLNAIARAAFGRFLLRDRVGRGEGRWIRRQLARFHPDLVILMFDAAALIGDVAAPGVPTVALRGFLTDRALRIGAASGEATPSPAPPAWRGLEHADVAGFSSLADMHFYREASGAANGAFVGMGFPCRIADTPAPDPVVLFVGARTAPNGAGIAWFLATVWPTVIAAVPQARLRIVGAVGQDVAPGHANTSIAGFVDDIDEEYRRAQVVIAPLLEGTNGIKTKVGEAFSHGRPLVTTSVGVDPGDPAQYGAAADVTDDPLAFADAVIRLLRDPALRAERNRMAAAIYHGHFSYEAAYPAIAALLPAPADHRELPPL